MIEYLHNTKCFVLILKHDEFTTGVCLYTFAELSEI